MPLPNFKKKHLYSALFTPQDFLNYLKKIGKYPRFKPPDGVIFCYSNRLLKGAVKDFKGREVKWPGTSFYIFRKNKKRIGLVGNFGIGAPVAVALLEELIAFGVNNFISIGEAGTLQPNLNVGDIVLCTKALRDEGCSYHYLPPSKYAFPDKKLTSELEKTLKEMNIPFVKGPTWTIDTPYRETKAEVEKYKKEGVLTVEMEASALFAVGKVRKVKVASLFTISDHLGELSWEPKFHLTTPSLLKIFEVALVTLSRA